MDKVNVGIVLLNWNSYYDSSECIRSILRSSHSHYRIYVVDNNSQDDSAEQLKTEFGDKIVLIYNEANLGFAKGNNIGINQAIIDGSDYIWVLNNDTVVNSESLASLVAYMRSDYDIGLSGSVLYEYLEPWEIQAWGGGTYNKFLGTTRSVKKKKDGIQHIIGASMFFSVECLKKCGMFDERFFFYMEDTELSLRIRDRGYKIGVAENSFVFHKGGSSTGEVKGIKSEKSDLLYARAVGAFMRTQKFPIYLVVLRVCLMIFNRLKRRQYNRVISIVNSLRLGYLES